MSESLSTRMREWDCLNQPSDSESFASEVAALEQRLEAAERELGTLRNSIIRRTGSSSWEEFNRLWNPTEETAIEAITRLAAERDSLRTELAELKSKDDRLRSSLVSVVKDIKTVGYGHFQSVKQAESVLDSLEVTW